MQLGNLNINEFQIKAIDKASCAASFLVMFAVAVKKGG
ncbi:hypothetical protein FM107_09085 [Sphingobacterium sp. JB170]|nr:hypothetical protein FM107_09085 [Sphingobacterium sp. JB170]